MNVPTGTQFLLFNKTKCLPDKESMKQLTSGHAASASFSRKTFGANFTPRDDVQVIVCANVSMYEHYGKYNFKTQTRTMDKDALSQFEDRFNYVKLDGDEAEERRRHLHPSIWTDKEYTTEPGNLFYATLKKPF